MAKFTKQILIDYGKENNFADDEDIEIMLEVSLFLDKENGIADELYISHDGSSGCSYKVSNTEDIANYIKDYLETMM